MNKRFVCFLLVLVLMLSIGITAQAATSAGLIYDETEQLLSEDTQYLGNEYYYLIVDEKGIAVYLDIYTDTGTMASADSIAYAAEYIYVNSGFGYGDDKCGMTLALHMVPAGESWKLDEDDPYALYCSNLPAGLEEAILKDIEDYLKPDAWMGDLSLDQTIMGGLAATLGNTVMNFEPDAVPVQETAAETAAPAPVPTVEAVMETAQPEAAETYARYTPFEGDCLIDSYGLLTEAEQRHIEAMAKELTQKQGCGVYVMIVDDFKQLNGNTDIYKANYTYYHDNSMGYGPDRDGIMLLLSMDQRDFSFFVYGDKAEYALNKWGQKMLENEFVDDLGDDRWYDGLEDFVDTCDEYMTLAAQGEPIREPPQSKMALATAISSFIALLASAGLWNKNKGAKKSTSAYAYISGEFIFDDELSEDTFINTTVSRRIIESSSDDSDAASSGSSAARSGGGGSGRSGKF
ncbi:MAG: TPM domain-containing protein [Oscillospiraceae bacterium]|nr:TPM domain-containing protein [Oscillospiraceae bacterium]